MGDRKTQLPERSREGNVTKRLYITPDIRGILGWFASKIEHRPKQNCYVLSIWLDQLIEASGGVF